jgi:hypothetical protein
MSIHTLFLENNFANSKNYRIFANRRYSNGGY